MARIDDLLRTLDEEPKTPRRVLERVPDDRLAWLPRERARTLGDLALHVATVPGGVTQVAIECEVQASEFVVDSSFRAAARSLSTPVV